MARIRRKKITSKLIENFTQRKMCYKNRLKGLLSKIEQMTTLCGNEACAIVFGPGDTTPSMWPSRDVAEKLIQKFESMPECVRFKNLTDQLSFLKEKGKKLQATLDKITEDNEEKLMGSYIYQIENNGKPLCDFEPSELNRLISFMLKKYKNFSKYFEEDVFPCNNEQRLNQQPLLDLVNQSYQMSSDFNNNIGSRIGSSPHENLNGGGGFGDMLAYQSNFQGGGDNMFLTQGNFKDQGHFGGFYGNTSGGVGMFPYHENFRGFDDIGNGMWIPPHQNLSVGDNMVFPQGKFEGFDGASSSRVLGYEVFPPNMFGVLNGGNDESNLFPQGDHLDALNGIPTTNDGSGMTMPMPLNTNEGNNNGVYIGSFNANLADNNYGNNFNHRLL